MDHEVLTELLAGLDGAAAAGDRASAEAFGQALHGVLDGHAAREEAGAFAELRDEVSPGYVEQFDADHGEIHRLVDELSDAGWPSATRHLASLLHAHIQSEETDLFPAAHQLLTAAQWDRIDEWAPVA
jgi:hemerythrin-like domain-containing protein